MIYYRFNVESEERKKERESRVEKWDIKMKHWTNKSTGQISLW